MLSAISKFYPEGDACLSCTQILPGSAWYAIRVKNKETREGMGLLAFQAFAKRANARGKRNECMLRRLGERTYSRDTQQEQEFICTSTDTK